MLQDVQSPRLVAGTVSPITERTLYCRLGEFPVYISLVYISLVLIGFRTLMFYRRSVDTT